MERKEQRVDGDAVPITNIRYASHDKFYIINLWKYQKRREP